MKAKQWLIPCCKSTKFTVIKKKKKSFSYLRNVFMLNCINYAVREYYTSRFFQQTVAIIHTLPQIYCLSLVTNLSIVSHQKGYQSMFSMRLVKLWWLLDRFTCLQKPALSFELSLPPKATCGFLNTETEHLAASLDLTSSFRNLFLFTALPSSTRAGDTQAQEYRVVFLSIHVLNLE